MSEDAYHIWAESYDNWDDRSDRIAKAAWVTAWSEASSRKQEQINALAARVAELEKDAALFRFLAVGSNEDDPYPELFDGFAGIDLCERAYEYAGKAGREVANGDDYLQAFRDACNAAMKPDADGERHD